MPLRYLLLDFNAYFASVEQQLRPELRQRPVAVLPVLAETTCCIAASYEARRYGVRTGTSVAEARRLCPEIVFVKARPAVYVEMHHRLMAVVDSVLGVSEVLSIDEVLCELTGSWQREEVIRERAQAVKAKIREVVGEYLRCSIGVGPNRFIAKVASNMQKPDGFTLLREEDLPAALYRLELADLHGIGAALLERLARHGIGSVEALCGLRREQMRRIWGGVEGERMYDNLRGVDLPARPTRRSSLGHSHVLPPHLRTRSGAYSVLSKLTQKAAARLRASGLAAGRMLVQVAYRNRPTWRAESRFQPMHDTLPLLRVLEALWPKAPRRDKPVQVSVTLLDLQALEATTLPLFPDGSHSPGLDAALDAVKRRYGNAAVYFGGAFLAMNEAPMRIAFTHIPNLRLEGDGGLAPRPLLEAG